MTLRPMTMADAAFMLELKNYPETRQYAITSHDEIKMEDHLKYLEANLQYFKVIEDNVGQPMGVFRLKDNEVSIWIKKELWKMGIATYVLQHETDRSMFARIVAGNISSMRAFIRAGFLPKSFQDNYYIFKR